MNTFDRFINYIKPIKIKSNIYILNYHGIKTNNDNGYWERNFILLANFKQHLTFLNKYRILSTNELIAYIKTNTSPVIPSFYFTFDDGYRNNLIAIELLLKKKINGSIFVTTNSITTGEYIWTIDLSLLFKYSTKQTITYNSTLFDLSNEKAKIISFDIVRNHIKGLPKSERVLQLDMLMKQFDILEIEPLRKKMPQFEMLNWNEIKQSLPYIEIGSHGVTHELLHKNQHKDIVASELNDSKKEIEEQLNKTCRLFAFPNGDYDNHSVKAVEKAGYELAFTTLSSYAKPPYNPFMLQRINGNLVLQKLKSKLTQL